MTNIDKSKKPMPLEYAAIVSSLGLRSIVLVGMMGVGKTRVGLKLAALLDIPFIDTDDAIEVDRGMKIADIFHAHGEAYFRAREAYVVAGLLRKPHRPQVLATGGGAFMNGGTRAAINAHGFSIWLKANFDVLMDRLRKSTHRPKLNGEESADELKSLLNKRNEYYRRADLMVEVDRITPDEVVEQILANSKLIINTLKNRRIIA